MDDNKKKFRLISAKREEREESGKTRHFVVFAFITKATGNGHAYEAEFSRPVTPEDVAELLEQMNQDPNAPGGIDVRPYPNKADCYGCIHRRNVPGDANSACHHPLNKEAIEDPLLSMFAIFAGVGRLGPASPMALLVEELFIAADPHGIQNNWFNWPWSYDPRWLENCDGFTPKE